MQSEKQSVKVNPASGSYVSTDPVQIYMEEGSEDLIPTQAHDDDAGYDLKANHDITLPAGEVTLVHTGAHVCTKGYFDFVRDGFGEVTYDLQSTVDRIIEYMENDCRLKDVYRERIDRFFAFDDQNNCARVFDRIREREGENA